ncbi:MAG: hypothetical protein ACREE6_14235 [Limisphaerales bacterium]
MSKKAFVFRIAMPVVLICLVLVATFVFYLYRGWTGYSSFGTGIFKDQDLIADFYAHRPAFENVQQMAAEDVRRGWYLGISDADKISEFRWQEYTNSISQIHPGLEVTMDGYGDGVRFIFTSGGTGLLGPGWVKGIEYVPGSREIDGAIYGNAQPPWQGTVCTNLDNVQTLPANVYLRPIESNWFIFYQRSD